MPALGRWAGPATRAVRALLALMAWAVLTGAPLLATRTAQALELVPVQVPLNPQLQAAPPRQAQPQPKPTAQPPQPLVPKPQVPPAATAASALGTGLRFAPLSDNTGASLLAALFNTGDRAAAAADPQLRVAVQSAAVPALLAGVTGDVVQGPLVQWLQALAATLGLKLSPVLVADEAAQLQAVREGRADLALAVNPPFDGPQPGLLYSLGTGAQPLAWVLLREERPVPLERARIALLDSGNSAEPSTADRVRRHYPGAAVQRYPSVEKALQAVVDRQADAYVGSLLPVLAVLQVKELPGLELRQVWPGAAGHRHLVLSEQRAALLPALNKALAAWRSAKLPHQAVLGAAHQAALRLRVPLALPADVKGADTAVMDGLIQPPYGLPSAASERLPLATYSTWRVGVVRSTKTPLAALSGLDAQGRHTGMAADMLQELALQLGVVLQMQAFDNDAALLEALRAGRIDIAPLLEHTPGQTSGLMFTLPWLDLPQVLVGREGGTPFWGLESLRGRRLALATGHPQRAELQRLHPGIQLVDAADGSAALALLQKGQADAAMDIKPVVQAVLGSPAGQGLQVLGDVANFTTRYRIGLPDSHRALLPLLDAALTDVNGQERQRSVRRWLVQEVPPHTPPWWQHRLGPAALAAAAALVLALAGWVGWRAWQRRRAEAGFAVSEQGSLPPQDAGAPVASVFAAAPAAPVAPVAPVAAKKAVAAPARQAAAAPSALEAAARRRPAGLSPKTDPAAPAEPLSVSELHGDAAALIQAVMTEARGDERRPPPATLQPELPREAAPAQQAQPVGTTSAAAMADAALSTQAEAAGPSPSPSSSPAVLDVALPSARTAPASTGSVAIAVAATPDAPAVDPAAAPVPKVLVPAADLPAAPTGSVAGSAAGAPAEPAALASGGATATATADGTAPAASTQATTTLPETDTGSARPSLFERAVAAGIGTLGAPTTQPAGSQGLSGAVDGAVQPPLWPSWPPSTHAVAALAAADPYEDLHLEQLLDVLMVPYYRQSESQRLRLVWSVDPVLPARIHSHPARLSHLIKLLMSRAMALTAADVEAGAGPRRVAFKAGAGKLDSGKPALVLQVSASCPVQADGHPMEPELQLAADSATELGGHLDLRSRQGVGHSVIVRLPLRGARREDRSPTVF